MKYNRSDPILHFVKHAYILTEIHPYIAMAEVSVCSKLGKSDTLIIFRFLSAPPNVNFTSASIILTMLTPAYKVKGHIPIRQQLN